MIRRDESEERFTRRLEAFSDIVIGFSLAQLGASLAVEGRAADTFFTDPGLIVAFLFPFAIICLLWFFHHRLFTQTFVPKTLPVIVNFLWLAAVVILVFAARAYTHDPNDLTTLGAYFGCYAVVYGLLAVQCLLAGRYAAGRGDEVARARAARGTVFMSVWTFPFVASFLVVALARPGIAYAIVIGGSFMAAGVSTGMLRRYLAPDPAKARV